MRYPSRSGNISEVLLLPRALVQELIVAEPFGNIEPFDYLVGTIPRFWRVQVKSSSHLLSNNMYQVGLFRGAGKSAPHNARPTRRRRSTSLPSTSCQRTPGTSYPLKSSMDERESRFTPITTSRSARGCPTARPGTSCGRPASVPCFQNRNPTPPPRAAVGLVLKNQKLQTGRPKSPRSKLNT